MCQKNIKTTFLLIDILDFEVVNGSTRGNNDCLYN